MSDRIYLLERRIKITIRFRREFHWSWTICWHTARVHQRHVLAILADIRAEEAIVDRFRDELERDLDQLTLEGAI